MADAGQMAEKSHVDKSPLASLDLSEDRTQCYRFDACRTFQSMQLAIIFFLLYSQNVLFIYISIILDANNALFFFARF